MTLLEPGRKMAVRGVSRAQSRHRIAARELSPSAQWTLVTVAGRMAEGAKISAAAREAGLTVYRAKRQLEELGEELVARR